MQSISGSFTAHITAETTLFPNDQPNHMLQIAEIRATQNSSDPSWNNARLAYHGITDLIDGNGTQRGYYANEHPDGDRDCGTFEGRVTSSNGQVTVEGTFTINSGSGNLKGIRGGGTYKGRQISPVEIQMTWTGSYEVAASARVA
jgi:hypothetical protein